MQPISPRRAVHCVLAALAGAGGCGVLARWLAESLGEAPATAAPWGALALALGGAFWLTAGVLHAGAARALAAREALSLPSAALACSGHLAVLAGALALYLRGETGQGFVAALAWLPPLGLGLAPLSFLAHAGDGWAARRAPPWYEGSLQRQATLVRLALLTALLGAACGAGMLLNASPPSPRAGPPTAGLPAIVVP